MAKQGKPDNTGVTLIRPPADTTVFPSNAPIPDKPEATFGPFGDKALHGSKLVLDTAKAKPDGKTAYKVLHWEFVFYAPANDEETLALCKAKPALVRDLVTAALGNKARAQSWGENRGGSVTVDLLVKGVPTPRVPLAVYETLKAAGIPVEIIPRVKKETK